MNKIIVTKNEEGKRIDIFLSNKFSNYSRSYIQKLIKNKFVTVNGKEISQRYKIKAKDVLVIDLREKNMQKHNKILPEDIHLDIIYEDNDIVIINKQPGLVVHPAAGHNNGTLVNALIKYFPAIKDVVSQENDDLSKLRPGLVHRLDKDTSGIIAIAKNKETMMFLSKQIAERKIKKIYWALCSGWPKEPKGHLLNYLGRHPKDRKKSADIGKEKGRESVSDYEVLRYYKDNQNNKISLIEFDIKTGRTHQIRIQSNLMNCPVLGDQLYYSKQSKKISEKYKIKRQLLHAKKLTIPLPNTNEEKSFAADLPKDFDCMLKQLNKFLIS